MILYIPRESCLSFLNSILVVMLQRLQTSKSAVLPRYFTLFVAQFLQLSEAGSEVNFLLEAFNSIQPGYVCRSPVEYK